jgi:DNA-binding MarR family transcriptional regulator
MRTAVTEESIAAYRNHRASGKLSAQQRLVMLTIHAGYRPDWSLRELGKAINLETSTLSARVHELIALRYLERTDKRRCSVSGASVRPIRIRQSQLSLL